MMRAGKFGWMESMREKECDWMQEWAGNERLIYPLILWFDCNEWNGGDGWLGLG